MKKYLCWHFLQDDKRLRWGTQEVVEEGKTYTAEGTPELCENGCMGAKRFLMLWSMHPDLLFVL